VQGDGVAVAGEVAGQVAAHHAQSGDAYLRLRLHVFRHLLLVSSGSAVLCVSLCHPGIFAARVDGDGVGWRGLNRTNRDDRVPVMFSLRASEAGRRYATG